MNNPPRRIRQYVKVETSESVEHDHEDDEDSNNDGVLELATLATKSQNDDDDDTQLVQAIDLFQEPSLTKVTTTILVVDDDENEYTTDQNVTICSIISQFDTIGIPICYLMVGLVQGFMDPLMNVYPLDLGASEAQQTTIFTLKELPSCFKILFGLLSDNIPIHGYRRKPYMLLGWMITSISIFMVIMVSDLSLHRIPTTNETSWNTTNDIMSIEQDDDVSSSSSNVMVVPPTNAPSIPLLSTAIFIWAVGLWLADVMGDALVAEKAKFETVRDRGNLQIFCYAVRGIGMAITAPTSTLIYNLQYGPWYILTITSCLPLCMVPFIYHLKDRYIVVPTYSTTRDYYQELWKTCSSRAVWQPMGFVSYFVK